MSLKAQITLSLLTLVSMASFAQDVSHNKVNQVQMNIQSSIRGTLDGVTKIPHRMVNTANQLVFPRTLDQNFSINPWSKKQQKPQSRHQQSYGGLPKGNPWAPVGANQNIPLDRTAVIERNPYTDAPMQQNNMPSSLVSNNSYRANQSLPNSWLNGDFNGSNNSFPSPFGNQFWPGNQFWSGGNNANSSMPFMPW